MISFQIINHHNDEPLFAGTYFDDEQHAREMLFEEFKNDLGEGEMLPDWSFQELMDFANLRKSFVVFVLFQQAFPDTWIEPHEQRRRFFGIFTTGREAVGAAKKNNLYDSKFEVQIVMCELNKFEEQ